jgi:peptidoglycan hydrolase-like amidase
VALTQFASSNGGYAAQGDYPYLHAHADDYDGVIVSQKWNRTITTASIERAWPSVGAVRKLKVTSRDGAGAWGGRVRSVQVIGSRRTVTVSGTTFQYRFGMRSNLFTVTP